MNIQNLLSRIWLVYVVLLVLLAGLGLGITLSAQMQLSAAPILEKIELSRPSYLKTSDAWEQFVKKIPNIPQMPKPLQQAMTQMRQGQWPQTSLDNLRLVFTSLHTMLEQASQIFQEKECSPSPSSPQQRLLTSASTVPERVQLLFRILVARAVIWSTSGSLEPSLQQFTVLHQLVVLHLTRCSLTLQESIHWLFLLRYLHEHTPFLLRHPQITLSQQQQFAQMLAFWQQPPTFLVQLLIQEYHDYSALITQHAQKTLRASWFSFWNQPDITEQYTKRWFRRYIYLAMQATIYPPVWGQAPIEKQLHPRSQMLSWYTPFRRNAFGFGTLSQTLSPQRIRKYLLFWFQQRCIMTALQLHWVPLFPSTPPTEHRHKTAHKTIPASAVLSAIPALSDSPYAHNPFTQRVFAKSLRPQQRICRIPKDFQTYFSEEEHAGYPLPPLPLPHAAAFSSPSAE